MGGGIQFLNKKSWHPSSGQNMEKVARREVEAEKEKRLIEERRKELAKERERDELIRLGQSAGAVTQRDASLDWMYAGSMASRANANAAAAAASTNVATVATFAPPPGAPGPIVAAPNANEVWRRMMNDPMVAIMQQEQAQRNAIRANPVLMQSIKREVEELGSSGRREGVERRRRSRSRERRRSRSRERRRRSKSREDRSHRHSPSHPRDSDRRYGLNLPTSTHLADQGAETRRRLDEASQKRDEATKPHHHHHHHHHHHRSSHRHSDRPRVLSDKERDERLAAMQSDALRRDEGIKATLVDKEKDDDAPTQHRDMAAFLQKSTDALVSGQSAAERIGSRSHYREKR